MSRKISDDELKEQVSLRAAFLCEYCHTNERWQYIRFTVDHIIPVADGGEDSFENLALACFHCNRRKSNKTEITGVETGKVIQLFNPRQHIWLEHFLWSENGLRIIPQTSVGRVTVDLLELNRERILSILAADVTVSRHLPDADLS